MYVAKNHVLEVTIDDDVFLEMEVKQKYQDYMEYVWKHGMKRTPSIPREQGDEISLMTELVLERDITNLYPEANEHGKIKQGF